jgi:hypothetical protein
MSILQANEQMRLARIESVCDQLRSEMDDILQAAYQAAVEEQDEDRAAELARKIRNKLLVSSDKECVLDKILPEAPSGTSFIAWLTWLRDLAGIRANSWGVYRQALRDLTTQAGFPFDIVWPDRPEE